jgi:hypothetical protein
MPRQCDSEDPIIEDDEQLAKSPEILDINTGEEQTTVDESCNASSRPKTSDTTSSNCMTENQPVKLKMKKKIDLLKIEKYEEWERHVYEALRSLCNEKCLYLKDAGDIISQIKDSNLKVEATVCVFRRVRDWHGFEHTVFKKLSRTERVECTRRLGSHNMYDEICAINYYELSLNNAGDRYIMGELTRLAVLEPGENMVDETYGGINFELPAGNAASICQSQCVYGVFPDMTAAGWCTETPNRGDYTTFYCRETVRHI